MSLKKHRCTKSKVLGQIVFILSAYLYRITIYVEVREAAIPFEKTKT